MTAPPDLPPVAQADLDAVSRQLGRTARGVVEVAHRCPCGEPDVVRTEPRLPDGTPFPTSFYATCPRLTGALSTLESQGVMREMSERLESDPELRERYTAAHLDYLRRRAELGEVPEVAGVSAGGMPARVKCLHVLVAHSLAAGPGVNPLGDEALELLDPWWQRHPCSADAPGAPAAGHDASDAGSDGIRPRVAAIDCGTNSLRLLVADVGDDGRLVDVVRRMEIVRLGQGIDRTGVIAPEAMARTLAVTREYAEQCRSLGVERVRFVATSASRDARNAGEFVAGVREAFGDLDVAPEVVAGDAEARFSFSGATGDLQAVGVPGPYLVVDLGGGSTELVRGTTDVESARSVDVGSVRMTERHLHTDPPSADEVAAARRDVAAALDVVEETVDLTGIGAVVGLAGTITTITAHALDLPSYDPDAVHLAQLPAQAHRAACESLLTMGHAQRAALPYLHPGRVDVIAGGALVWESVLERALQRSPGAVVVTSEHDILDGIALSLT